MVKCSQEVIYLMVARPKGPDKIKLSLMLPEDVIMQAKIHAIEQRTTLSDLIEGLLRSELEKKFLRAAEKGEPYRTT